MKNNLLTLLVLLSFGFLSCEKDHGDNKVKEQDPIDTAFTFKVEFESMDSLLITADHYHISKDSPIIVLCHQAGYSRGAYMEIAPKLNAMGYNCIAIDQRSGAQVKGVQNETNARAVAAGKPVTFLEAKQDITAAVAWANAYYGQNVILWGSSYSSSLSLMIAHENKLVESVLAFSPGEYIQGMQIAESIQGLNQPTFLTSSKSEISQTTPFFNKVTAANKVQFKPSGNGEHGSKALWEEMTDHEEYWTALTAFLNSL